MLPGFSISLRSDPTVFRWLLSGEKSFDLPPDFCLFFPILWGLQPVALKRQVAHFILPLWLTIVKKKKKKDNNKIVYKRSQPLFMSFTWIFAYISKRNDRLKVGCVEIRLSLQLPVLSQEKILISISINSHWIPGNVVLFRFSPNGSGKSMKVD